jgi:hypothetical protein
MFFFLFLYQEQTIPLRSMHDRLRKLPNELTIDLGCCFHFSLNVAHLFIYVSTFNRNLLEQGAAHADVSFQFPDGTNLPAHRNILSVRSPVLLFRFFY